MADGTVAGSPAVRTLMENGLLGALPPEPPASSLAFPGGGSWRVELPSVEGPAATEVALKEAESLGVPVHRISQGSGVTMLSDREIVDMVQLCRERSVELCLFARPGANWDVGASRLSPAGSPGTRARGTSQLRAAVEEIMRASALGVASFLVADEGVLWAAHRLRATGRLPARTQLKVSVMAAPANPVSFTVQAGLGADTINVSSDLSLAQLAEMRGASDATIDFYVETPDNLGGFVRYGEIGDIVRVAAPVYLKFGLRNAPDIYPAGAQLDQVTLASTRERVRRARLGLDQLARRRGIPPMAPLGERDQPALPRFAAPDTSTAQTTDRAGSDR
ncbi:hypothetical protein [Nonomuraea mesophila]|uniref:hypothetical protein n=1 Tax=Nonomuraea mesophila TaxID=2530382 RepID=UPI0015F2BE1B|nr:hypothetical protein [Nonomuraea mesophila]